MPSKDTPVALTNAWTIASAADFSSRLSSTRAVSSDILRCVSESLDSHTGTTNHASKASRALTRQYGSSKRSR